MITQLSWDTTHERTSLAKGSLDGWHVVTVRYEPRHGLDSTPYVVRWDLLALTPGEQRVGTPYGGRLVAERTLAALAAELGNQPGELPPIVYADEAVDSWVSHIEAINGWNGSITLMDGTSRDVVFAGHDHVDSLLALVVTPWDGDEEPARDAPTETIAVSDIARIRAY